MKKIRTYFRHCLLVLLVLFLPAGCAGVGLGMDIDIGDNMLAYKMAGEGPHVFQQGDQWLVQTVRGGRDEGFWLEVQRHEPAFHRGVRKACYWKEIVLGASWITAAATCCKRCLKSALYRAAA